jgi:hypothetical protein
MRWMIAGNICHLSITQSNYQINVQNTKYTELGAFGAFGA